MTSGTKTLVVSRLQDFLEKAHRVFGLDQRDGRGNRNPHPMLRPLQLTNERLISDGMRPEEVHHLASPLLFLTHVPEPGCRPSRHQPLAAVPSVSVLIGEIGLGKTEFVFQLCDHLRRNQGERAVIPLPVNLSMCRWMGLDLNATLGSPPDALRFARLIFAPIFRSAPEPTDEFLEEVIHAIHNGELMLVLDSLDELISHRYQHQHFFEGLRALFEKTTSAETRFRCLVSMRFEYIRSYDTPSGAELVSALRRNSDRDRPLGVHFLHLDFLNDSWVQSYLRNTSTLEDLVDRLQEFPAFFELLQRPIFLNMIRAIDRSERSFKISELSHPVQLVRVFVETAGTDDKKTSDGPYFSERDTVARHSGYTWNTDNIARAALDQYKRTGGYVAFKPQDIIGFLVPLPDVPEPAGPLNAEQALVCVQKCPFLHQFSQDTVVFSHNVFQEYFVSRGIVLDLDANGDAFDQLVLNSDMRFTLKYLIDEQHPRPEDEKSWYRRTRRSYALDRPEVWQLSGGKRFEDVAEDLDAVRRTLLDYMTDPRTVSSDLYKDMGRFFEYETRNLHPRYLMYNYEAVAVYLWKHSWEAKDQWRLHEFGEKLVARARVLQFELEGEPEDREGHELLAERVLSIARRLQMDGVMRIPLQQLIRSDEVKARMGTPDVTDRRV
jgi:hypothetical protein